MSCRLGELRRSLKGFEEAAICCTYGIRNPYHLAPSSPKKKLKQVIPFFWDMTPSPLVMGSRIFEANLFSSSRIEIPSLQYFDPCRLGHYGVAKHQRRITKWHNFISQNNGMASHAPIRKLQNTQLTTLFLRRDPFGRPILPRFLTHFNPNTRIPLSTHQTKVFIATSRLQTLLWSADSGFKSRRRQDICLFSTKSRPFLVAPTYHYRENYLLLRCGLGVKSYSSANVRNNWTHTSTRAG